MSTYAIIELASTYGVIEPGGHFMEGPVEGALRLLKLPRRVDDEIFWSLLNGA